jgi:hypothetical protein
VLRRELERPVQAGDQAGHVERSQSSQTEPSDGRRARILAERKVLTPIWMVALYARIVWGSAYRSESRRPRIAVPEPNRAVGTSPHAGIILEYRVAIPN